MTFYEFCDANDLEPDSFSAEVYLQSGEMEQDYLAELEASGMTREQATKDWEATGREVMTKALKEAVTEWKDMFGGWEDFVELEKATP